MFDIRPAGPADLPGIVALDEAVARGRPLSLRREFRRGRSTLSDLYPGTQRFVAVAPDRVTILGVQQVSMAPTQFNGAVVTGAYFFGLEVHPAQRGRGTGLALKAHAWEQARADGAEIAWAINTTSNEPSNRIDQRLGFRPQRNLQARIIPPALAPTNRTRSFGYRPARPDDFEALADALNDHYADHHLWRPLTPQRLQDEAAALRSADANLMLAVTRDGQLVQAASVFVMDYTARPRLFGRPLIRSLLDPLLSPLSSVQLVRYAMVGSHRPAAELVRGLQRRHARRAWTLAANLDPLDPAWPTFARLPGITQTLQLWVHSPEPLDPRRPCCLV
jgi:ribosomal protein S18 acetylase RimI-like enzyme